MFGREPRPGRHEPPQWWNEPPGFAMQYEPPDHSDFFNFSYQSTMSHFLHFMIISQILSCTAWSRLWIIFYQVLSIKKKLPKFFFGASCIISDRISNYFLVFDWKKVSLSLSSKKLYICYFSWVLHLPFKVSYKTWQSKKNNKKYNKDYIGLILANNERRTSIRKTIMDYGQTK